MAEVYMAGDVRNGTTFELDGAVYKVVEFQHVKPGKGAAFVRTKLKNVINGSVLEKTFNPSEKLQGAEIEKREMQYLYKDGDGTAVQGQPGKDSGQGLEAGSGGV